MNYARGDIVSNSEIVTTFKCGNMGGMRYSLKTNALVLVSDPFKGFYEDEWSGDVLHYTGMGKEGDQILKGNQNLRLYESKTNGVDLHLFEVNKPKEYTYLGNVELASEPYQEFQNDSNGNNRKVWIFPLKVKGLINNTPLNIEYLRAREEELASKARNLSTKELIKRAMSKTNAGKRSVQSNEYQRDTNIAELTKRRANGKCELCDSHAPFKKKNGEPFLEVHHITWLAKGGDDNLKNTVALCPNCHRKMHSLNNTNDIHKLTQIAKEYVDSVLQK
ncbi:MAG: HNH endonuclease signature motif containing protein [Candidatus Sedimenticola sp. PURPLELP]